MKTHFTLKRLLSGLTLLVSCNWGAFARGVLPVLVSDGMVLQQNTSLTIWGDTANPTAWAELRNQQAKTVRENAHVTQIKNSDTGEWNDIHSLDKKTVATRLVEAVIQNEKYKQI